MRRTTATAMVLAAAMAALPAWAEDAPPTEKQTCIDAHEEAQRLRLDKALLDAKEQLMSCARESCPGLVRQACSNLLTEVQTALPTLAISITEAQGESITDATTTVDGEPWPDLGTARDIDPGVHEIRVAHPLHGDAQKTVTIVEGRKNQLVEIVLGTPAAPTPPPDAPPPPASSGPPIGAFVLWGGALVATGVGATLGGLSLGMEDDVQTQADLDELHAFRAGADIGFIAAGALAVGGVVWWIVDASSAPAESEASAGRPAIRAYAAPRKDGGAVGFEGVF